MHKICLYLVAVMERHNLIFSCFQISMSVLISIGAFKLSTLWLFCAFLSNMFIAFSSSLWLSILLEQEHYYNAMRGSKAWRDLIHIF